MSIGDLYNKIVKVDLEVSSYRSTYTRPIYFEKFEVKDVSYAKDPSDSSLLINVNGILTGSGNFNGKVFFDSEEKNKKVGYMKHEISHAVHKYLKTHKDSQKRLIQLIEDYIKKNKDFTRFYTVEDVMFPIIQKPFESAINQFKKNFTLHAVNTEKETLFFMDKSDKRLMEDINFTIKRIVELIKENPLQKKITFVFPDKEIQTYILSQIENYENLIENVRSYSEMSIVNNIDNPVIKDVLVSFISKHEQDYFMSSTIDFSLEVNFSIKLRTQPKLAITIRFELKSSYIKNFLKYFKTFPILDYKLDKEKENLSISYFVGELYVTFYVPLFTQQEIYLNNLRGNDNG